MSDTWGKGAANNNIGWGQAAGSATNNWGESQKTSYAGQTDIVGLIALSISYSADNYCDDSGNTPQPTVSNNTGSGTFASTAGLIIDTNTGVINTNTSTAGSYVVTYTDTDADTATATVVILNLDNAAFAYSASSFEPTDADPTPTITGLTGGTFSGTTGLVINSTTGEIDLSASTVASHTITYNTTSSGSSVCPNTSTQTVEIALAAIANNYSMSFDGSSEYISTGFTISSTSSYTLSAWFKTTTTTQDRIILGDFNSSAANASARAILGFNGTRIYLNMGDGTNQNNNYGSGYNASSYFDGNWHLYTLTINGFTQKAYLDGTLVETWVSTVSAGTAGERGYTVGRYGDFTSTNYFNGSIDEVGIWNTALTSTQVSEIYNATDTNLTKDLTTVSGSNLKYWNRMGD